MADNSVHLKLADEFGYPGSANCVDYLRILFTPEEGELLREFIEPATCQEVSTRPKMDARGLQDKLDNFMARGLLFHGKTQYVFQLGIHVFFNRNVDNQEEYIPPDFWDVYKEFHLEEIERLWLPQQTKSALAGC